MANANSTVERIAEVAPRAKLTEHEVELIREMIEDGMTYQQMAAKIDKSFSDIAKLTKSVNAAKH